jgi:proline iminopeptidase
MTFATIKAALFALASFALTTLANGQQPLEQERMVSLPSGVQLFMESHGSGPPMLVIHGGLGLDHTYFQPWLNPLQDEFRLVYLDLRSNGRSSVVADSEFTLDKMTDDLEGLRIALGMKQWVVLGHSYGGLLAQLYALKFPDAVSRLILVDTSPAPQLLPKPESSQLLTQKMTTQVAEGSHRLAAVVNKLASEGGDEEWRAAWRVMLPIYFSASANDLMMDNDRIIYREHALVMGARLIATLDLRQALARVSVPTLIVVGQQDAILPVSHSLALQRSIPESKLEVFQHSGHFPFVEEPAHFVEVIRDFLITK